MKKGPLGFVLAFIDGDDPEVLSERVRIVVETAHKYGGFVDSIFASKVLITFGMFNPNLPGHRPALVQDLSERLGAAAKIIHGERSAISGNLSVRSILNVGSIIAGFPELLQSLSSLDFGEVRETPPAT